MKYILCALIFILSLSSFARTRALYGNDDRVEVDTLPAQYQPLVEASVAFIPTTSIHNALGGMALITAPTFGEFFNMCPGERFADQISGSNCSGCLVGPQHILTAGHCMKDYMCAADQFKIVFGYKGPVVQQKDIYTCQKIISRADWFNDYVIIELNRPVTSANIVSWRRSGLPSVGDELLMIGTPSGIPLKGTSGFVQKVSEYVMNAELDLFMGVIVTDLDAYGGNSGSCVFNKKTKELEGVLVQGEKDFKKIEIPAGSCRISDYIHVDKYDVLNGEKLSPITSYDKVLREINP